MIKMYYEINVSKKTGEKAPAYRHFFATAPRSCTTMGQTKIVLKELVEKFSEPEYSICINYYPESGEIYNVWDILPEESPDFSSNRLMEMFDLPKIKQWIKDCQKHECVILLNNWSINRPKYSEEETLDGLPEADQEEMESYLGFLLEVNQYDDLIVDPFGILN